MNKKKHEEKPLIKVWHAHVVIHDAPESAMDGGGYEPYITRRELREELIDTVGNSTAGVTVAKCRLTLAGYKARGKKSKK